MRRFKKAPQVVPAMSALQVRRAYKAHFGRGMDGQQTYEAALKEIVAVLGWDKGCAFVVSQSNDPTLAD